MDVDDSDPWFYRMKEAGFLHGASSKRQRFPGTITLAFPMSNGGAGVVGALAGWGMVLPEFRAWNFETTCEL